MDISIRLAKITEKEKIIDLQTESLRTLSSKYYKTPQIESLVRGQALLRFKEEIVCVATYDETIVGFSSIHVDNPEIYSLFVAPKFTRQGIGTRLLQTLEKIAIHKKHKFIYVTSSLTAKNFYTNRGYQKIRESGFYSEGKIWVNTVLMKKKLISSGKKAVILAIYLLARKQMYKPLSILIQDYRLISYTTIEKENQQIVYFVGFLIIIIIISIVLSLI